jgi:hypothetical protein
MNYINQDHLSQPEPEMGPTWVASGPAWAPKPETGLTQAPEPEIGPV